MKNLTVGKKFIVTFGTIVLLFLITVIMGLAGMSSNRDGYSGFYQLEYDLTKLVGEIKSDAQMGVKYYAFAVAASDSSAAADFMNQGDTALADAKTKLSEVSGRLTGQAGKSAASSTDQKQKELEAVLKECRDLIQSGKAADQRAAQSLLLSKGYPASEELASFVDQLCSYISNTTVENYNKTMNSSLVFFVLSLVVAAIALITTLIMAIRLTGNLTSPIRELEKAVFEVENGNLHPQVTYQSKDELGKLADSVRSMTTEIAFYMDSITKTMNQLAEGDLNVGHIREFKGEFNPVQHAIRRFVKDLNTTIYHVEQVADQVSQGADQVSGGSQSLTQGATEQASSVEELAATTDEIAVEIKKTSEDLRAANTTIQETEVSVLTCNGKMKDMVEKMNQIRKNSERVSNIIKTIDDIAFQTNILALNAAVEAARAGSAGKGFAVVADEVRNLAAKSAEASSQTEALIKESIVSISEGVKIADEAATSMDDIGVKATAITDMIKTVSGVFDGQAEAIAQITQGVDQISSVVQTNSATSQESAAASEELSSQALTLKNLIGKFKLNHTETAGGAAPSSVSYSGSSSYRPAKPQVASCQVKKPAQSAGRPKTEASSKHYELTPDLETGNSLIDSEHRQLFAAINDLMDACSQGKGRDQVNHTVEFLVDYVAQHFSDEEQLQMESNYPNYPGHKRFHEKYKQDLAQVARELAVSGATILSLGNLNQTVGVLINHIRKEDKRVAEHVRNSASQKY